MGPLADAVCRPRTTPGEDFAALAGLRGLAALWVMVYHAWVLAGPRRLVVELGPVALDLTPLCSLGWAGVQIFFLLSGFLLALPFARYRTGNAPRPRVGAYLLRRVARVYPAYLVQLAVLLCIVSWTQHRLALEPTALLGHLAMAFGPPPLGIGSPALNGAWWTLPVELSFYLLLPLLTPWLTRRGSLGLLVVGLAIMAGWRLAVVVALADAPVPVRVLWSNQLPGNLDSFLLGVYGAVLQVGREQGQGARPRHGSTVSLASLTLAALLAWMHLQHDRYWMPSALFLLWTPLFGGAVLLVVRAGAARWPPLERTLGHRVMQGVGLVSYGIYLWHLPLLEALSTRTALGTMPGYRFPWLLASGGALTLLLAALSWWLVERQAIAAARRMSARMA